MVRAAQAAALAKQYTQTALDAVPQTVTPSDSANQAAVVSISEGNNFTTELEKHLADYRNGRGDLSKKTSYKIQRYDEEASSLLQGLNPKAFLAYSAYGSTMTYERRARFVSNVYTNAKNTASIGQQLSAVS